MERLVYINGKMVPEPEAKISIFDTGRMYGACFYESIRTFRHIPFELDAHFAGLYGLTRDELRYILDPADVYGKDFPSETFRVLKNKEIRKFGEYRTRRLVLEAWDRLEKNQPQAAFG